MDAYLKKKISLISGPPQLEILGSSLPKVRANVSKVEECKQFVYETVNHFGRCKCMMGFLFSMAFVELLI